MHLSMFANLEPYYYQAALKEQTWNDVMVEELTYIENNKT